MTHAGKRIRVLVVDDSAFMRKVLQSIIASDPQLEVCGEARDGRDAVTQTEVLKPDVISMDINMPHMDGLQATEIIMSSNPRPILIVSSESKEGADVTLKALELGAIDFVAKPSGGIDLDMSSVKEELCRKLKMSAKVRVVRTATRSKLQHEVASSLPRVEPASRVEASKNGDSALQEVRAAVNAAAKGAGKFPIVVLASSTGGPATLMKFLPSFPKDFPGAVILVQHMPGNFTSQFSTQLAEVSQIRVKEAEAGEIIVPGQLYVCPGSHHLRVSPTGRISLDDGPRVSGYRPCADLTFESAAEYAGPMTIGVILTGMGNDGAKGAQTIRSAGGHVIAQDESTAVIFGMPQEAIKTGAVDQILPMEAIYHGIEKRVLYIFGAAKVGAV
ncbi:MAG TPA: chemotaxis response regulator protein-glutamate methylesterase [Candidatus Angelobacter sp.]|jgi:two-component system chemotaxis response regulator CheB|nr:chemotaxis response regulator protein-glutamate methylesterase [Candidatus Angelobacter sp.]